MLRSFEAEDYNDLYEFLSQRKDEPFEGYPGITYENGKAHLKYRIGNDAFMAVVLKETGKVIGNVYAGKRDFHAIEIGYIINKDYQRRGYAAEALRAVINRAFEEHTHRIYAECAPQNECSWRLLEHMGFAREAHFKQNVYFNKGANGEPLWLDTYVYCLLSEAEK